MKKLLFSIFILSAIVCMGAVTTTTLTNIGGTGSYYIKNIDPAGWPSQAIGFWVDYTKGDETSISLTFSFAVTSTVPAATDLFSLTERNADNSVSTVTVVLSATAKRLLWVQIPTRATYAAVTVAYTGGTTGAVVLNGYIERR